MVKIHGSSGYVVNDDKDACGLTYGYFVLSYYLYLPPQP